MSTLSLRGETALKASPSQQFEKPASVFKLSRIATAFQRVLSSDSATLQIDPEVARRRALELSKEKFKYFAARSSKAVLMDMNVDFRMGLTDAETVARLTQHGRNELTKEPPRPFWKLLLDQFSDLLVIMLLVAAIVAFALQHYESSVCIIIIVGLNAYLGVTMETKAGAALDALESLAAPTTTVLREGQVKEVDSATVVPGDIVILELGKRISADIRLIESEALQCGEMALTGESEGVAKDAHWVASEDDGKALDVVVEQKEEKKSEGDDKPAKKKEDTLTDKNMVYMGCTVQDGHGKGVIVKTGMQTKMGEVAHLLSTAEKGASPLQRKLEKLGTKLGLISICISVIVFLVGVTTKRGTDPTDSSPVWLQMLLVAVSLTVAAVPEGLPVCVTITLAKGMNEMTKRNALIRNLRSVETLGSATVICTDKTGTLTKGVMTAVRLWFCDEVFRITGAGYDPIGHIFPLDAPGKDEAILGAQYKDGPQSRPLFFALLCSNARLQRNEKTSSWECVGNSSERPLVVAAKKAGFDALDTDVQFPRLKENPFNSARKMMSTLHDVRATPAAIKTKMLGEQNAQVPYLAVVKGAPNFVLKKCKYMFANRGNDIVEMTDADVKKILKVIDDFSEQAFRVLAVAFAPRADMSATPDDLERDLILTGLVASIDPERVEVGPSIAKAARAGIRTVMITGDYVKTAKAIAENIGLLPRGSPAEKAVDCDTIREMGSRIEALNAEIEKSSGVTKAGFMEEKSKLEAKLDEVTAYADVYARAKPLDKITIVRSLQRQGNVCSMTGDGVNDAPALKQANIGVAMGITGTDVAKAAADMVLVDDNFCSIVEAIEQGRTIYANIQKFVFYLLSTNSAEVFTILVPVVMGLPSPLAPMQILWMNLATDGAPALALAVEKTEGGCMNEGPRDPNELIIDKVMAVGIAIQMPLLTFFAVLTYCIGLNWEIGTWNADDSVLISQGCDAVVSVCMNDDQYNDGVNRARTMVIIFICFAELIRAYSCRSLRDSVFTLGIWSNVAMQKAVAISMFCTLLIIIIPGLNGVFGLMWIPPRNWVLVLGFSFIPFVADEITKLIYRRVGFGKRPIGHRTESTPVVAPVAVLHAAGGYSNLEDEVAASNAKAARQGSNDDDGAPRREISMGNNVI